MKRALVLALALGGCVPSVRAGDYYGRPLYEAAPSRPSAPAARPRLTVRFRIEPPPPRCAATDGAIVLLPALGITQHDWAGVTARLASCRARVLVDGPGIGESPPAHDFDGEDVLAALGDVLDAVSPDAPVVLAGHSLGGTIAARLAERRPDRVRALILVDAPLGPLKLDRWERLLLRATVWPPLLHLVGAAEAVHLGLARVSGGGDRVSPLDDALVAREWSDRQRRRAMLDDYRAFLDERMLVQAAAQLDRLRVPVLLVWGADDRIVPLEHARRAEAQLRAVTTVQLEIIAATGHMAPMVRPAETARLVDQFLATIPPDGGVNVHSAPPAMTLRRAPEQRRPGDRVWGPGREIFPILGINALFPLDGRADLSLVAGVARGGVDRAYPVEAGRVALTAGATMRVSGAGASFAYLRATARLELIWRWAGGFHVDGTLLVDPRDGRTGGYGALGYAASALPWTRFFVAGGSLPGEGARVLVGIEVDARLTGLMF